MQCQKCGQAPATVFLTHMIDNETHKIDLCDKCAKKLGITEVAGFALKEALSELTHLKKDSKPKVLPYNNIICPQCGCGEEDLHRTGRLGCPSCYDTFKEVRDVIRENQKKMRHVGKSPARQIRRRANEEELARLQEELADAIRHERYEEAGWLRDQIRLLKESLL